MTAATMGASGSAVRLTHPERVLWPAAAGLPGPFTKHDLSIYLDAVAPWLLMHIGGRPLVLTRYPQGITGPSFYQKHLPTGTPSWLASFSDCPATDRPAVGRAVNYAVITDRRGLAWLAQQAAIEFHPWSATAAAPERPDRAIIDLDPAPPATFADACAVARTVRELLSLAGLRLWCKTSGATGVHLCLPIRPAWPHRDIVAVVRALGLRLSEWLPGRVTLERAVARRSGRVYVDYLQNARGQTVCAPYTPRALPGAPVSMPLPWDELGCGSPPRWHLGNVPERLRNRGDAWADLPTGGWQDLRQVVRACAAPLPGADGSAGRNGMGGWPTCR